MSGVGVSSDSEWVIEMVHVTAVHHGTSKKTGLTSHHDLLGMCDMPIKFPSE